MTQFSIKQDIEIEKAGGFWCQGCLIGKPAGEQSDDPKYCHECFKFFLDEAELLPETRGKPYWVPSPGYNEASLSVEGNVTKLPTHGNLPAGSEGGIMLQKRKGGRPSKPEGERVTRMTRYRRKKKMQGRFAV